MDKDKVLDELHKRIVEAEVNGEDEGKCALEKFYDWFVENCE